MHRHRADQEAIKYLHYSNCFLLQPHLFQACSLWQSLKLNSYTWERCLQSSNFCLRIAWKTWYFKFSSELGESSDHCAIFFDSILMQDSPFFLFLAGNLIAVVGFWASCSEHDTGSPVARFSPSVNGISSKCITDEQYYIWLQYIQPPKFLQKQYIIIYCTSPILL